MRISHDFRFIFVAVPRTGSTSVRKTLDPYADIKSRHVTDTVLDFPFYHHMTANELKRIFEMYHWAWGEYRKFCIVRNPWDRLVSVYHHWIRINSGEGPNMGFFRNARNFVKSKVRPLPSFLDFAKSIETRGRLVAPLTTFIHNEDGECLVDDVLKFEEIEHTLPDYLRRIGVLNSDVSIPHLNQTQRKPYQQYYDEEAKQMVAYFYRYEIENFGYTFEE